MSLSLSLSKLLSAMAAQKQTLAQCQQQLAAQQQQMAAQVQQIVAEFRDSEREAEAKEAAHQQENADLKHQIQELRIQLAEARGTAHPQVADEKGVLTWDAEKVCVELQKLSPAFAKHRQKFIENNVNGTLLQSIVDDADDKILRSIKMVTAQRKQTKKHIAELLQPTGGANPPKVPKKLRAVGQLVVAAGRFKLDEKMQKVVVTDGGGSTAVETELPIATSTIRDVKREIQRNEGTPIGGQTLFGAATQEMVEDEQTLLDVAKREGSLGGVLGLFVMKKGS